MSLWSAFSTSPIWTGAAVWVAGISPSDSSSGADGEPGWRSTKKLPSRKMRGRIFSSASSWIGRPLSSISIVTLAASSPASTASTFVTFPTSTPAIRTGERVLMLFASWKYAVSSYGFANGFACVNANQVPTAIDHDHDHADLEVAQPAHGTSARLSMPSSRDL